MYSMKVNSEFDMSYENSNDILIVIISAYISLDNISNFSETNSK